jgi:glycosyltransferase involved in cell wall biosynthesis
MNGLAANLQGRKLRVSLVMVAEGAGGVQQSIVPYGVALRRRGHLVQAVLLSSSPLLPEVNANGMKVWRVRWGRESIFGWPHLLDIGLALRSFKPDIVIGFVNKGYRQARAAAPRTIPVVGRCGTTKEYSLRKYLDADALIVTSAEMEEIARRVGFRRTYILPNFICDPPRLHPRNAGPARIGAFGRFVHEKGFDLLLQAAARLKAHSFNFTLAIGGDGKTMGALKEQAASLGVDVAFPGWLDGAGKAAFLDNLDIFVCPSRDEPFGIVFLEAMQAGLPIVAADTVGARAIFRDGEDGLIFQQEDVPGMAAQIARLVDSEALRDKIASAGRTKFLRCYHVDSAAVRLEEILRETLENAPTNQIA